MRCRLVRPWLCVLGVAVLGLALLVVAPAAATPPKKPPGSSAVNQYVESIPTAGGAPTTGKQTKSSATQSATPANAAADDGGRPWKLVGFGALLVAIAATFVGVAVARR